MQITELQYDAEFEEMFPVIRKLHHDLDERRYRGLIPEMRAAGYRMFAVREERGLVAAGVQKLTNLYYGRHFYLYDLSATDGARSKGHGERLLRHVEEVAREEGCGYGVLACGREREDALRFYEDHMGYGRLLHAPGVVPVIPKAAERGCPISARKGTVGVGQSGP